MLDRPPTSAMRAPTLRLMTYPPRWNTVLAPAWPPRVTGSASVLYAPSRRITHAANWAAWSMARLGLGSTRWRRTQGWEPPMGEPIFRRLLAEWSSALDGPVDGFVVYRRLQDERSDGGAVLVRGKRSAAFVKFARDDGELAADIAIGTADTDSAFFAVPEVRSSGVVEDWHWVATEPISLRPHAPVLDAHASLEAMTRDIDRLVDSVLDRPAAIPDHWTGSHGDLTPWNLRRAGGRRWLIDWSGAGWRPPGADALYYRAVTAAIARRWQGPPSIADAEAEAAAHWRTIQESRTPATGEDRLHVRLLETFGQVR